MRWLLLKQNSIVLFCFYPLAKIIDSSIVLKKLCKYGNRRQVFCYANERQKGCSLINGRGKKTACKEAHEKRLINRFSFEFAIIYALQNKE